MINILVCDDNTHDSSLIEQHVKYFCLENNIENNIYVYNNPVDCTNSINQNNIYDLCILDIVMPGISGIEIASQIHNISKDSIIIFLTSSTDYYQEAFSLEAIQYLAKPLDYILLNRALKRAFIYINSTKGKIEKELKITTKFGIQTISESSIEYIESNRHILTFYLIDGREIKTLTSTLTLSKLIDQLSSKSFFSPYKGFIINFNHVNYIEKYNFFMLNGTSIPIPVRQFSSICKKYLDYLQTY